MDNPAYVAEVDRELDSQKNGNSQQHKHTFEEAIELSCVGRFHYMLLLICGLCFMAVMAETMGVSIIMPSVKCELAATQVEQGILASAGFLGIVLSSHMMGFLADTWGRVRTLRYSLVMATIATLISAFSVNIWMLIIFRITNGFFISGCQACIFSLCGEFHSNKTRVRYVTLLAVFLPLALIFLPAIGLCILPLRIDAVIFGMPFSSWRLYLITNSGLSILGLLGLLSLPETPKYMLVQGDHDAALDILRQIYSKNTGNDPKNFPVKSIVLQASGVSLTDIHGVKDALKMIWGQTAPLFYRERCLHTLNICFSLVVIYGIAQGTFMWFPTILNELIIRSDQGLKVCHIIGEMELAISETSDTCSGELDTFMFQVLMMIGSAFTVIYFIFAYTIDLIGKVNLLIIWLAINATCAVLIHWVSDFFFAVIILTLIMSVGNCGGIIGTISIEFFPTHINAMGMCFVMMMGRLGAVAGGNIIGLVLFNYCDIMFWAVAGIVCILIALGALLPEIKRTKKRICSAA